MVNSNATIGDYIHTLLKSLDPEIKRYLKEFSDRFYELIGLNPKISVVVDANFIMEILFASAKYGSEPNNYTALKSPHIEYIAPDYLKKEIINNIYGEEKRHKKRIQKLAKELNKNVEEVRHLLHKEFEKLSSYMRFISKGEWQTILKSLNIPQINKLASEDKKDLPYAAVLFRCENAAYLVSADKHLKESLGTYCVNSRTNVTTIFKLEKSSFSIWLFSTSILPIIEKITAILFYLVQTIIDALSSLFSIVGYGLEKIADPWILAFIVAIMVVFKNSITLALKRIYEYLLDLIKKVHALLKPVFNFFSLVIGGFVRLVVYLSLKIKEGEQQLEELNKLIESKRGVNNATN